MPPMTHRPLREETCPATGGRNRCSGENVRCRGNRRPRRGRNGLPWAEEQSKPGRIGLLFASRRPPGGSHGLLRVRGASGGEEAGFLAAEGDPATRGEPARGLQVAGTQRRRGFPVLRQEFRQLVTEIVSRLLRRDMEHRIRRAQRRIRPPGFAGNATNGGFARLDSPETL